MPKHHYEHNRTHYPEPETTEVRGPYWARAHRDWRFLAVVFIMLACVAIYILTGDFGWVGYHHAVPALVPAGN